MIGKLFDAAMKAKRLLDVGIDNAYQKACQSDEQALQQAETYAQQVDLLHEKLIEMQTEIFVAQRHLGEDKAQIDELMANIKGALQAGRRDLAANYTTTLQQVQRSARQKQEQLARMQDTYDKGKKLHDSMAAQLAALREQTAKIVELGKENKRAADRIAQAGAHAKSAWQSLSLGSVDSSKFSPETADKEISNNELLRQFEMQVDAAGPPIPAAEKTLGPGDNRPAAKAPPEAEKTVGPKAEAPKRPEETS